jgi:transcriptional regulator with XRE-family HTH domain
MLKQRLRKAMALAKPPIKSAAEFGRRAGLPDSTARAYLGGRRSPRLEACREIGAAIGVDGDWLYTGRGDREAAPARGEPREAANCGLTVKRWLMA